MGLIAFIKPNKLIGEYKGGEIGPIASYDPACETEL
jgi:hypothetical protein